MSDETQPNSHDPIRISLVRREEKVYLDDQEYTLREMTGKERDAWMTSNANRVRTNTKGEVIGVRDFKNLQAGLIAKCLYDGDGKRVKEETIAEWPPTAQNALFKRCQDLNGLLESEEDGDEGKD